MTPRPTPIGKRLPRTASGKTGPLVSKASDVAFDKLIRSMNATLDRAEKQIDAVLERQARRK